MLNVPVPPDAVMEVWKFARAPLSLTVNISIREAYVKSILYKPADNKVVPVMVSDGTGSLIIVILNPHHQHQHKLLYSVP